MSVNRQTTHSISGKAERMRDENGMRNGMIKDLSEKHTEKLFCFCLENAQQRHDLRGFSLQ